MNAPALFTLEERPPVLRVFGGRLDGAEYRIDPAHALRLGHGLDNDIVIRGEGTRGCRIELRPQDASLRVVLLAGEASLLGQPLEADRPVLLPPFVPLVIGEYSFAIGPERHERWGEAEALAGRLVRYDPEPAAERLRPESAEVVQRRAASLAAHLPRWMRRPQTLFVAAAALLALLAIAPIRNYATRDIRDAEAARMALAAGGFASVTAERDPAADQIVFQGTVRDDNQLADLREMVADDFPGARMNVDTNAALARAATDMLAAEGIDADVRATGPGLLTIASEYLPADRQRELTDRLKSDLPALRRARFDLTGERGADDLAYFFGSAAYGLATYVDGAPGYLVTVDGSYWFEGAMLPTGHEIVSARNGRITVKRNGLLEEILVDPAATAPAGLGGNAVPAAITAD